MDGIEELPGFLGIAIGQELHRAFEVGKENRDMFALALQGCLGGEDLIGEIFGGIAIGRGKAGLRRCATTHGASAFGTELGCDGELSTTAE